MGRAALAAEVFSCSARTGSSRARPASRSSKGPMAIRAPGVNSSAFLMTEPTNWNAANNPVPSNACGGARWWSGNSVAVSHLHLVWARRPRRRPLRRLSIHDQCPPAHPASKSSARNRADDAPHGPWRMRLTSAANLLGRPRRRPAPLGRIRRYARSVPSALEPGGAQTSERVAGKPIRWPPWWVGLLTRMMDTVGGCPGGSAPTPPGRASGPRRRRSRIERLPLGRHRSRHLRPATSQTSAAHRWPGAGAAPC